MINYEDLIWYFEKPDTSITKRSLGLNPQTPNKEGLVPSLFNINVTIFPSVFSMPFVWIPGTSFQSSEYLEYY